VKKRIFFTDHAEDLPLMRACQKNCWFGERGNMPQEPNLRVIPCLEIESQPLFELVSAL
jgi:phosphoserine phosphatase